MDYPATPPSYEECRTLRTPSPPHASSSASSTSSAGRPEELLLLQRDRRRHHDSGESSSSANRRSGSGPKRRRSSGSGGGGEQNRNGSDDNKEIGGEAGSKRPDSPIPDCPICLCRIENMSYTDSCFHKFCFTCLLEWSKVWFIWFVLRDLEGSRGGDFR